MGAKGGTRVKTGAAVPRTNGHSTTVLKPVAISDDGTEIVLARRAGAKSGEFRIAVDEALIKTIKAATRRAVAVVEAQEKKAAAEDKSKTNGAPQEGSQARPPQRAPSKLTPKEIQGLLRRGIAPASIARKAGVDVSWVERFHGPILWERAGMVSRAQKATLSRSRGGPSGEPLMESITRCLRERRVDAATVAAGTWDAVRRPKKNAWVVTFSFTNKGREQRASWEYDPAESTIVAVNRLGADIGWVPRSKRKRAS
ncbi:MAG: hypothetical protein QOG54_504 [Actinomycetota bacterium]|jgi:hypothetical protein|nr:hypothetical protein [Actinomycetota bacterium]